MSFCSSQTLWNVAEGSRRSTNFDANNRIVEYSFDAANLLNDTFRSYTYDAENRVTAVHGGSTASYAYDAAGRGATILGARRSGG